MKQKLQKFLSGRYGFDNRTALWLEVCWKGKKLWISENFVKTYAYGGLKLYDKDGNCVEPVYD